MQITDLQQMFRKREEYAYLRIGSKEASEQMISDLVGSATNTYLTKLQKNAEEIKKKLRLFRDEMRMQTVTESISRPDICARVVSRDMLLSIMEVGLHECTLGYAGTFIFWYDVAEGFS